MTTAGRLRIAALDAVYLIADGHPSPARIRERFDDVVRKDLPAALASTLQPAFQASDESLWFIRRLDVSVDVNAAWEADTMASSWATQITRALAHDLCGAGDGTNVIRFRDRAAYLAQFVIDAASGDAWSHWFYRSFDGLRALPIAAAIRTALAEEAELGLRALQRLALRDLAAVIGALSETEAARTLIALAGSGDAEPLDAALAAAAKEWRSVAAAADALSLPRAALALFVRTAAAGAGGHGRLLAAEAVAALAAIVRTRSADVIARLRGALTSGDVITVRAIVGNAGPSLDVFARLSIAQLDDIVGQIAPSTVASSAAGVRPTRFGGAVLLLPFIDRLPFDVIAAECPALGKTSAAKALRWLVLVKSLGQARADIAFRDPVLRDLFELAPDVGWPQITAWLVAVGLPRRHTLAHALAYAPKVKLASSTSLRIAFREQDLSLWIDREGFWRSLSSFAGETLSPVREAKRARRRHADPASELDYLALPSTTGVGAGWDHVLSVAAQQVMRAFAHRMPGFAQSGAAYLHRNFLDFDATLEFEAARIVCRLGRPPLHLMLSLTGVARGTMQFVWLEQRPLALFAGE